MSPLLPPDGEDVLIVNFLSSFAAVTASSANLAVVIFALEMFAVKTASSAS
jgi:hypothetical protein